MIEIRKKWLFILIALPAIAHFSYENWHEGTPYREKQYSPNKEFYYQQYRVVIFNGLVPYLPSPGGFSSEINGYVRAYTADGNYIGRAYAKGLQFAVIFWWHDKLIVMGGNATDEDGADIIKLPGNSMKS